MWSRANGAGTIVVSEPVASRRQLATELGATHVVDPLATDLATFLANETGGPPSVVIECAGRPGTLEDATNFAGYDGTIVIAGMHMQSEGFHRMSAFLNNLTVRFCCWYTVRHYRHTLQMLAAGRIDPGPMITHRVRLDELDEALQRLKTPNDLGKVLVSME